jgi:hypothetical protein
MVCWLVVFFKQEKKMKICINAQRTLDSDCTKPWKNNKYIEKILKFLVCLENLDFGFLCWHVGSGFQKNVYVDHWKHLEIILHQHFCFSKVLDWILVKRNCQTTAYGCLSVKFTGLFSSPTSLLHLFITNKSKAHHHVGHVKQHK